MDAKNLAGLIETLELLVTQVRAYERALPPDNFVARSTLGVLGELAKQALNEAQDILALSVSQRTPRHPFSKREHEVLKLAAQGLTNKEIAYRLGLSERTIQFHLNSIFNKTGTNSRTEVAVMAMRNLWLDSEKP